MEFSLLKVSFMKRKSTSLGLLCLLATLVVSCSQEQSPKPWIPALEETTFIYLTDTVDKALQTAADTQKGVKAGDSSRALEFLEKTRHSLLKLKLYDVPLTEFRQIVYDADRLFYLGRKDQAKSNLKKGKEILLKMVDMLGTPARESIDELIQYVEELEVALDHAPEKVGTVLKTLGERVNLMLLKGDLVLAGTSFRPEH